MAVRKVRRMINAGVTAFGPDASGGSSVRGAWPRPTGSRRSRPHGISHGTLRRTRCAMREVFHRFVVRLPAGSLAQRIVLDLAKFVGGVISLGG
jgi:hypothetical protein